jgi:hypothetical protein
MKKYRHFLLYAKGHYIHNDLWDDLVTLVANYTMVEKELITKFDVMIVMVEILKEYISKDKIANILLKLDNASLECYFKDMCEKPYHIRLVTFILDALRFVQVRDELGEILVELGEPDPKILSINENRITL